MRREHLTAYILLTFCALFWAGTVISGRAVAGEVPPLALNFWRWVLAFVIAAPIGLPAIWRQRRVILDNWPILIKLALLNVTMFGSLVFVGLQYTGAVNGSLLLGTMPINIVLVSWIVLRTGITARALGGVVLGFAGLLTIVARGDISIITGLNFNAGDPLMWLGLLSYALYSVWLPRAPKSLDLMPMLTVLFLVGALACLPLYLWETMVLEKPVPLTFASAWSIGYLGLFPSLLAQIFWIAAVQRVGANTAGYFIYLAPVFGTMMAIGFLGETFAWYHGAGTVLIFVGILIATHARKTEIPDQMDSGAASK
jgi:drug/metabolite transporter (DMT)-like permease